MLKALSNLEPQETGTHGVETQNTQIKQTGDVWRDAENERIR